MSDSDVGVVYFNHGTSHCARLVVSLLSLRKRYDGPATILDTGSSDGIIEQIAGDVQLSVSVKRIKIKALRRHSCYVRKASLWRESPYRATLFLDADTLIARSIRPLLDIIADDSNPGFVVTRFADWISTGDIISARIRQWRSVECDGLDVERMVRQSLDYPHPALNTGVMGWRTDSADTLGRWEKLTAAGHKCSFTDELAAQLIVRQEKHTLLSSRFNASPIYYRGDDVIIWHAHGRKHLSRADGRGHEANAIWEPVFREAFANNAGGICDWAPAGDATLANNMKLFA